MTNDLEFDHQGDAYVGRKHTEQSISFGMESKKVNKKSACFSVDLVGAKGEISAFISLSSTMCYVPPKL